jgi:hypothetical protein
MNDEKIICLHSKENGTEKCERHKLRQGKENYRRKMTKII